MCLEGDEEEPVPAAKVKAEGEKRLRAVNEVLGKAAPGGREARDCAGT